jgi:predicted transcriptional regulator
MRTISLRLPEDLLADLERAAKARRVSKSVVVRESLEENLRARPHRRASSCYDLARDLAGTVKGLPRDLATNPKYIEGFGE